MLFRSIYVTLVLMSIIWLAPFVFLIFQSFRSYKLESGGMVSYLLPKQWSLDNYRFLFEGSNFFAWCGKALIACAIAAIVQTGILAVMKNRLDAVSKKSGLLYTGLCLLAGWAVLMVLGMIILDASVADAWGKLAISLVLYGLVGYLLARSYLKQDDRLLRMIPGYMPEEEMSGFRKMAMLCLEFLAIGLVLLCVVRPMETSQYLRWYGNTLTIALFVAVLQTIIVLSVSYALSRLRFKGRKLIMNAVLVLGLFPGFQIGRAHV